MLAIILCAGRGTRMGTLTDICPKPMLMVQGKNLIEWKLEALPQEVTKVILVVGYMKEMIMSHFGSSWNGVEIIYINQLTLSGTGGALLLCKDAVRDEKQFLVLMGDDIYDKDDLLELSKNRFSLLVSDQGDVGRKKGWQVFFDNNQLQKIHQEVEEETSPYINAGAYSLGFEYFSADLYMMANGEYSLPHTLLSMIDTKQEKGEAFPIHVVISKKWIQITDPKSIDDAETFLKVA